VEGQRAPLAGTLVRDTSRSHLRPGGLFSLEPACLFARAYRCKRFEGEAAFGKDTLLKQTFYGFGVHVRVCWPGVITRFFSVAPANAHELSVVPDLLSRIPGAWWSGTATTGRLRLGRNWPGGASSWWPPTGPRSATHDVPR
jgi:hypothetical protein